MAAVKQRVIELIKGLPDDRTLEDILYHLYVRGKTESGIRAVEEGRTIPQKEVERKTREWKPRRREEQHKK
ncbi:hypothetical protein HQ563_02355 [bacterium]|nr:hypothetical protein [bacterium]